MLGYKFGNTVTIAEYTEGQHVLAFLDGHLSPPSLAGSGYALMLRGRACCDAGDFRGARDAFRRMRLAQPERLAGLEYLSTALWHLRAATELAALAHELTEYAPDAWQTWVVVGNAYSAQRDHGGALRAFRKAIALDGAREAYPHSLAGHELLALGRLDEAMESFRLATHREGRAYHAWHGIGVVYFKQGDLPRAELHFRKAAEINKRSASVLVYLAMSLTGQPGKEDEALATLSRATCVDPTNPQAMYQRGLLLLARKRPAEAVAELQAAREAAPAEPGVLVTLGKALRADGRLADAVEAWNTALALTRSDKDAVTPCSSATCSPRRRGRRRTPTTSSSSRRRARSPVEEGCASRRRLCRGGSECKQPRVHSARGAGR